MKFSALARLALKGQITPKFFFFSVRTLHLSRPSGVYFGCKGSSHITPVNFSVAEQTHNQEQKGNCDYASEKGLCDQFHTLYIF